MKENFIKRSITSFFMLIALGLWITVGAFYLSGTFGQEPIWSASVFMGINTILFGVSINEIISLKSNLKWHWSIKILIFIMAFFFLWMPLGNEKFGIYIYNLYWFEYWFYLIAIVFFLLLFLLITLKAKNFTKLNVLYIFLCTFYLVLAFKAVNFLMLQHNEMIKLGWPTILYVFVIAMSNDIGGYLGGMMFGKNKLAPHISPSKTWEGAFVATAASVVLGFSTAILLLEFGNINVLPFTPGVGGNVPVYIAYLGMSFVLSIIGQFGDLLFSYLKRLHNVKDFSNIFPGHGGILDRIDGLSLVVILTYFVCLILV